MVGVVGGEFVGWVTINQEVLKGGAWGAEGRVEPAGIRRGNCAHYIRGDQPVDDVYTSRLGGAGIGRGVGGWANCARAGWAQQAVAEQRLRRWPNPKPLLAVTVGSWSRPPHAYTFPPS